MTNFNLDTTPLRILNETENGDLNYLLYSQYFLFYYRKDFQWSKQSILCNKPLFDFNVNRLLLDCTSSISIVVEKTNIKKHN